MRHPYNFETCIICLDRPCGDWEHVLPHVIGGRLQGRMLCNSCNATFGSSLVSQLKSDVSIQYAVEALKDQLPGLYAKIREKATFIGNATDGSLVRASLTNQGMKILPGTGANNSLIIDTNEAANSLLKKLTRHGISPEEAIIWRDRFISLTEDIPLQIPTGETFVKQPTPPLRPEFSQSRINDRLPVLIAFEFLSLLIGNLILSPSFHPVRQYIQYGDTTRAVTVQRFGVGRDYHAFHTIAVHPIEKAIRVDIRLFKWIAYVVIFYGFDYRGLDSVYIQDLLTPQSLFAPTRGDASHGNWFSLEDDNKD